MKNRNCITLEAVHTDVWLVNNSERLEEVESTEM